MKVAPEACEVRGASVHADVTQEFEKGEVSSCSFSVSKSMFVSFSSQFFTKPVMVTLASTIVVVQCQCSTVVRCCLVGF